MKQYQVFEIKNNKLVPVFPTHHTTFKNRFDAICLAHELEVLFKGIYAVKEI